MKLAYITATLAALGGWLATLSMWKDALTPQALSGLALILAGVFTSDVVKYIRGVQK